jgi:hypothetical protein
MIATNVHTRKIAEFVSSEADIVGKFHKLTRGVMHDKRQDALIDAVLSLDKLPNSRTLIERLRTA